MGIYTAVHNFCTAQKAHPLTASAPSSPAGIGQGQHRGAHLLGEDLYKKLIDRLRPFVEAKNPGAPEDPETKTFKERIEREADDLKLESFGVEVSIPEELHASSCSTVGSFYIPSVNSIKYVWNSSCLT